LCLWDFALELSVLAVGMKMEEGRREGEREERSLYTVTDRPSACACQPNADGSAIALAGPTGLSNNNAQGAARYLASTFAASASTWHAYVVYAGSLFCVCVPERVSRRPGSDQPRLPAPARAPRAEQRSPCLFVRDQPSQASMYAWNDGIETRWVCPLQPSRCFSAANKSATVLQRSDALRLRAGIWEGRG
jgi:hypothetical protein